MVRFLKRVAVWLFLIFVVLQVERTLIEVAE